MPTAPRFLAIAPQGLGDSLEATPLIEALRLAQPGATIDVIVMRAGPRELFSGLTGFVDEVIYLPYWEKGAAAFVGALARARWRQRYDAAFLAYPAYRREYHLLARAFPAVTRFAHDYVPDTRTRLSRAFRLVPIRKAHNVLRNMDLLAAAGIAAAAPSQYLVPADWVSPVSESRGAAANFAVHVGTIRHDGLDAKRWPLDNFVAVCRALLETGAAVTMIMGPEEREETQYVKSSEPRVGVFEGSLREVARFLSSCRAVLTNDSGIGHLAAGVGANVVSLFGPTPLEYAPFGPTATALRPTACPPCFEASTLDMSCKLNIDYACLKRDLSVPLVLQTMLQFADA